MQVGEGVSVFILFLSGEKQRVGLIASPLQRAGCHHRTATAPPSTHAAANPIVTQVSVYYSTG